MPETQLKYDSSERMTPGQFKQLGALLFSLVPVDLSKGFADELIDGKLHKRVCAIFAEERRDWCRLHSRMDETSSFVVPATPSGTLLDFMQGLTHTTLAGNIFWYRGAGRVHSVARKFEGANSSFVAPCYRTTGEVGFDRFVVSMGLDAFRHWPPALTPVQGLCMLDSMGPEKEKWKDASFYFFVGRTHNNKALFLEARPGSVKNLPCWELNEWTLEAGESIPRGTYLVFSRPLFR